jgi:hypothetical protein
MANCDLPDLLEDSKCLNCLSATEKKRAFLHYVAVALNDLGGGNYTNINDLREAVKCWCTGGPVLDSFEARIGINLAVNSGALAEAPTIAEVREAIKCWCDIQGDELKAMQAFLICNLLEQLLIT